MIRMVFYKNKPIVHEHINNNIVLNYKPEDSKDLYFFLKYIKYEMLRKGYRFAYYDKERGKFWFERRGE